MRGSFSWADYQDRMNRVITHIYDHLDEELDLNKLAEIACLSPYHWHRVYRGLQGETLNMDEFQPKQAGIAEEWL